MPAYNGKKVLIVGDANVDLIVPFPHVAPGGAVDYYTPTLTGGGTAANTALALRRLGVEVRFMGSVGDDQYGRYILNEFAGTGIDAEPLIVDRSLNTVCVFAFVDERGERYLWGWPRERQSFKELYPEKIMWEAVEQADWIHSSGMVLTYDSSARHSVIEIFKRAHALGIPTSFDLNLRVENDCIDESYKQAVLEIMEYCSYVLGSGSEEIYYLNPCPDWRDSVRMLARPDRTMIARMGPKGSMAVTPDECWEELPYSVEVKDTVGAGDVYNAGFIAARLSGKSLNECIIWGNGVSSYKVSRTGSRATPDFRALQEFLDGFGVKMEG